MIDYIKTKIDAGLIDAVTVDEWYKGLSGLVPTDKIYEEIDTTLKLDQTTPQTITASPKISTLTAGRVALVGTNGIITDSANNLFSEGSLLIR